MQNLKLILSRIIAAIVIYAIIEVLLAGEKKNKDILGSALRAAAIALASAAIGL